MTRPDPPPPGLLAAAAALVAALLAWRPRRAARPRIVRVLPARPAGAAPPPPPPPREGWSRAAAWLAALGGLLLLLLLAALLLGAPAGGGAGAQRRPPPPLVAAAEARSESWRARLSAIGTFSALRGVDVTTDTPGIVSAIHFDSGDRVGAGALLVELDAEADRAQLQSIEAQLAQARVDLARSRRLLGRGAVAAAEAEQAATAVRRLEAELRAQRSRIDDKRIEAPFAGELGIRQVNPGQYLSPGQPVATLQQTAPIHLDFTLPERALPRLAVGLQVEARVQAWPDRVFEGRLAAISPVLAAETRSLRLQAILPNDERLLRPGMFAAVTVLLPERREVVVLPATAVTYNPYGDAVFLLRPAGEAEPRDAVARAAEPGWLAGAWAAVSGVLTGLFAEEARSGAPARPAAAEGGGPELLSVRRSFVRVGERRGEFVEVLRGVEPGERVVTAGQIKIADGQRVRVSEEEVLPGRPDGAAVEGAGPREVVD